MRIALVMRDCGVHSWTSHEKKMQRGHCRPAEKSSAIKNNNDEKTRSDRLPTSDLTTAFGHTLNAQSLQKPCTKSLLERRAAGVRNGARMETKSSGSKTAEPRRLSSLFMLQIQNQNPATLANTPKTAIAEVLGGSPQKPRKSPSHSFRNALPRCNRCKPESYWFLTGSRTPQIRDSGNL